MRKILGRAIEDVRNYLWLYGIDHVDQVLYEEFRDFLTYQWVTYLVMKRLKQIWSQPRDQNKSLTMTILRFDAMASLLGTRMNNNIRTPYSGD